MVGWKDVGNSQQIRQDFIKWGLENYRMQKNAVSNLNLQAYSLIFPEPGSGEDLSPCLWIRQPNYLFRTSLPADFPGEAALEVQFSPLPAGLPGKAAPWAQLSSLPVRFPGKTAPEQQLFSLPAGPGRLLL